MKKIVLIVIIVLILFLFFIPIRKVVKGCAMFGGTEKTEFLTAYQAFRQGYLQIPNPDNYWSLKIKTEPPSICV